MPPAPRPSARCAERHQRQRSALAVVVGAQQHQHVFRGHHDYQRPQDQRENAEHHAAGDRPGLARSRDTPPLSA